MELLIVILALLGLAVLAIPSLIALAVGVYLCYKWIVTPREAAALAQQEDTQPTLEPTPPSRMAMPVREPLHRMSNGPRRSTFVPRAAETPDIDAEPRVEAITEAHNRPEPRPSTSSIFGLNKVALAQDVGGKPVLAPTQPPRQEDDDTDEGDGPVVEHRTEPFRRVDDD